MFFRNLTLFRMPAFKGLVFDGVQLALKTCALKPVGPSELMSRGFVPPMGQGGEAFFHLSGSALWVTLGGENRLLPSSVVNAELSKRIAAIEEREGRRMGGRARKRLKEDVVAELLPRALVKPSRLDAYLDLQRQFVVVDTASRKHAENLVSELRHALGSFPALPAAAEVSMRGVLTGWLYGEPLPEGLALGDGCLLRDPVDGGASARLQRQELGTDEIHKHLESGKQCTRLALVFRDHVSFELGEDLVLRKVRFLDGALESLDGTERDGLVAELDARFALMSLELGALLDVLEPALKLAKADDELPPRIASESDSDPLYDQALKVVVETRRASISTVQRALQLGYNRAARLIEALEAAGVVSPPNASGERKVLRAKAEG